MIKYEHGQIDCLCSIILERIRYNERYANKKNEKGEGSTRLRKDGRYEYCHGTGKDQTERRYTSHLPLKPKENLNVKLRNIMRTGQNIL